MQKWNWKIVVAGLLLLFNFKMCGIDGLGTDCSSIESAAVVTFATAAPSPGIAERTGRPSDARFGGPKQRFSFGSSLISCL